MQSIHHFYSCLNQLWITKSHVAPNTHKHMCMYICVHLQTDYATLTRQQSEPIKKNTTAEKTKKKNPITVLLLLFWYFLLYLLLLLLLFSSICGVSAAR